MEIPPVADTPPVVKSKKTVGQGLVEFALVLPILLLVMLGILEAGRLLAIYSSLSSAARQASRYGSVAGDSDPGASGDQPYYQDCAGVRLRAKQTALFVGLPDSSINISFDRGFITQTIGVCPTSGTLPVMNPVGETIAVGDRIVVSVTATYRLLVPLVPLPDLPMTFVAARTIFPTIVGPTLTPQQNPDLVLTKQDSPDPATPGSTLTYTLRITNSSTTTATSIKITDTLPSGVTTPITVTGGTCSVTGLVVTCSVTTLAALASTSIIIQVTAPLTAGAYINTASATYSLSDPNSSNNLNIQQSTTVQSSADLALTKQDAGPVFLGAPITYTLRLTNTGPSISTRQIVTDVLPSGVGAPTLTSFAGADASWNCQLAGGSIVCTRNSNLAVGAAAPVITIVMQSQDGGQFVNTAQVSSLPTDPVADNNTATTTTAVSTDADLSLTKSDGADSVMPGAQVNYTLNVANLGPALAQSVRVVDVLPTGFVFVSASGTDWVCVNSGQTVTCDRALDLPVQSAPAITIVTLAPGVAGSYANTATASQAAVETNTSNNSDTESVSVINCLPGVASASASTLTASASATPFDLARVQSDDGVPSNVSLVVTLRDSCGNLLQGHPVTLNILSGGVGSVSVASGTTNASGQYSASGRSAATGSATYQAVSGVVTISQTQAATFVCVTSGPPLVGSTKTFDINFSNATGLTRKLHRVVVTWTQASQKLKKIDVVGSGTDAAWDGDANSGTAIGIGGTLAWKSSTDTIRTVNDSASKRLRFEFDMNFTSGTTYTVQTYWSDTSGSSVCSAPLVTMVP